MVENELAKRKDELQSIKTNQDVSTETWKEKLSTYEEVNKFVDTSNETLKTKKLDFEAEINEE